MIAYSKRLARIIHRFSSRSDEGAGLTRRAKGGHRRRTEKYVEETDRVQHRQDGCILRSSDEGGVDAVENL
jgi:hypothetical protein